MMKHTLFLIAVVWSCVALLMLFGCNLASGDDDDDSSDGDGQDDDAADDDMVLDDDDFSPIDDIVVTWFPCSLYEGADDNRAECSSTAMPFNWFDEDGRTFTSYAKRLRSSAVDAEGQLWLLHGGPGASGVIGFPGFMEGLQSENPKLDLYTIDPRGTGFSGYAACPAQQSATSQWGWSVSPDEMDACISYLEEEYGDDLGVFNTTNSALDLGAYIDATKQVGKKIFIWGGSGGAFWAQRYLQFFPEQASGVILEGIPPAVSSIAVQDEYADKMALKVFELCQADDFCSQKLPDPLATLVALYDKLDGGHCSEIGMDVYNVKAMIDQLLYYYPHYETIPAFIFRVDRCNEEDKTAIVRLFNILFGSKGGASKDDEPFTDNPNILFWSDVLFWNEMSSELWELPEYPDYDAIVQYLDGVYEDPVIGYEKGYTRNDIYSKWPRYTDPYDDIWAETDTPMLMLNGMLDPSTPYDWAAHVTDHYNGTHQHFFGFPYSPHSVTGGSPYTDDPEDLHCADTLWFNFMKDPTGDLDSSCVEQTLPPDFEGTLYAYYFFGTRDYWENEIPEPIHKSGDLLPWRFHFTNQQLRLKLQTQYPELREHVMELLANY